MLVAWPPPCVLGGLRKACVPTWSCSRRPARHAERGDPDGSNSARCPGRVASRRTSPRFATGGIGLPRASRLGGPAPAVLVSPPDCSSKLDGRAIAQIGWGYPRDDRGSGSDAIRRGGTTVPPTSRGQGYGRPVKWRRAVTRAGAEHGASQRASRPPMEPDEARPVARSSRALDDLMADVASVCVRAERLVAASPPGLERSVIASAADDLLVAYRHLVRAREVRQEVRPS